MIEIPDQTLMAQLIETATEPGAAPITVAQGTALFAAWVNYVEGDDLGTRLEDPETGAVATRITRGGLHQWAIVDPATGDVWYDMQPTLPGWHKVKVIKEKATK